MIAEPARPAGDGRLDQHGLHGHPVHDHPPHPPRPAAAAADLGQAARTMAALGDAERLRLLDLLADGERCVSDLVELTGARMTTVSQRLRLLREQDLVTSRREGKHVYYRLADGHVTDLLATVLAHAAERL